jgi:hypothetical protein
VEAEQAWRGLAARRPGLTDEATPVDVEEEAIWVQETLTTVLNQHAKPVRVTVWSKRWWGKEIKESRRAFARVKRAWKEGSATEEEYKKARNEYYRGIRQAKRKCWENFLTGAEEGEPQGRAEAAARCWKALRYTTPKATCITPALKGPQNQVAVTIEEKEAMVREAAFPPRPASGVQPWLPSGEAHRQVGKAQVRDALFSQSIQKAPGIDRLNFRAIRPLWRWDSARIVALTRQCLLLRLGVRDGGMVSRY